MKTVYKDKNEINTVVVNENMKIEVTTMIAKFPVSSVTTEEKLKKAGFLVHHYIN